MHQILIVEDDPALSQGIRLALGQEGRQFVQAGTIGQAERELAERTFDLLILDLNLPDGNGLDLLSRLRDRSALPVLILTANDLEMDQVTGLELGADDYVTKPFSLAVLRARVNSLLRRSRPAPAALELPPFLFDFDAMFFARDGVPLERPRRSSGCYACWWSTGDRPCPGRCCWTGCGTAANSWTKTPFPWR